ncbi:MAG: AAA family ATPase [Ornithinimicrobium sp.]|uniref:AAA family ATPase n=1 Tax=Ornithinimicrobium sp. TaxID=1977084 RepID=UPI0026DECA27|nr:AAA family ATPase [Ornithinimicrobium sp.]MDO5740162.1 AAA family ATPase [Ornithinimicrobium sp.]
MNTQPLRDAVDILARIGREAGLDEGTVRAEGMALAASVMESSVGASELARSWGSTFGRPASDFFGMVSKGRRYGAIPTVNLQTLVEESSAHARGYAEALASVATSACTVPGVASISVGRATSAAHVQLGAVGGAAGLPTLSERAPGIVVTPPAGELSPAPAAPTSSAPVDLRGWSSELLRRAQEQSERVRAMLGHLGEPTGAGIPGTGLPPMQDPWVGMPGAMPPTIPGADQADAQDPATGTAYPPQPMATQEDPSAPPTPPEPEPQQPEHTVEELLAELDELIGLERVKAEIHRQVAVLKMEARRQEAGLKVATLTRHLVFVGNPGTGKTTVARLIGGIYRALELLSKGQLVEVDRSELVAGYLGQTAAKTAEVVSSALGGVLFIDEAYSLNSDQYGKETIDTLVKEMEDHRDELVVIVAGYPAPMAEFISMNPGLESRFRTIIEFDDYSDDELVAIQHSLADKMDYDLSPEATERFRELLAATPRGPSFGNGRFSRNLLEAAIGRQAWRLRDADHVDVEALRTLERGDFEDRDAIDLSTTRCEGSTDEGLIDGRTTDGDDVVAPAPGEVE